LAHEHRKAADNGCRHPPRGDQCRRAASHEPIAKQVATLPRRADAPNTTLADLVESKIEQIAAKKMTGRMAEKRQSSPHAAQGEMRRIERVRLAPKSRVTVRPSL
jgi:hypothetical protein